MPAIECISLSVFTLAQGEPGQQPLKLQSASPFPLGARTGELRARASESAHSCVQRPVDVSGFLEFWIRKRISIDIDIDIDPLTRCWC